MFRRARRATHTEVSFPRIRGDVPAILSAPFHWVAFSPHTRGCSLSAPGLPTGQGVFPAYAGMFRERPAVVLHPGGFPRIRGDVPPTVITTPLVEQFSPHTRGCSQQQRYPRVRDQVFPAYAGMFLKLNPQHDKVSCFPRIRGDVPC